MSEHIHQSEHHTERDHSSEATHTEHLKHHEATESAEHHPHMHIKGLEESAKATAISAKEFAAPKTEATTPHIGIQRELKADAYRKTLAKVQTKLHPTERFFSQIVHRPAVESASNVAGSTIARPSGLLGGGIVALASSTAILYMSKHYGFRYNYLTFVGFFVGGFLLGITIEMLVRLVTRKQA